MQYQTIPIKDRIKMRNLKIKALYKLGFSMEEVCTQMKKLGYSISTTTAFFAINGRSKKSDKRLKLKRERNKIIKKLIK